MIFPNCKTERRSTGALTRMGFLVLMLGTAGTAVAAGGAQTYPDGHGGKVSFPQGDVSFADAVEHYDNGDRAPKNPRAIPRLRWAYRIPPTPIPATSASAAAANSS